MCLTTSFASPYQRWVTKSNQYSQKVPRPADVLFIKNSPIFITLLLVVSIAGAIFVGYGLIFQLQAKLMVGGIMLLTPFSVKLYEKWCYRRSSSRYSQVSELFSEEGLLRVRAALVTTKRRFAYPSHLVDLGVFSQKTIDFIQSGETKNFSHVLAADFPLNEDGTKNFSSC